MTARAVERLDLPTPIDAQAPVSTPQGVDASSGRCRTTPRRWRRIAAVTIAGIVAAGCGSGDAVFSGPEAAPASEATPPVVSMPTSEPGASVDSSDEPADDQAQAPTPTAVAVPTDLEVTLTPVLSTNAPVDLIRNPTTGSMLLASKDGQIRLVDLGEGDLGDTVLDLSGQLASESVEQGLLAIAVHPSGSHLYTDHTRRDGTSVITEWALRGDVVDEQSGRILLTVDQPAPNHNGGDLLFSADGLLHITFGDGGAANDKFGNGQNVDTLLGTVLRIDPRRGDPYAIPEDNPFATRGGRPEILYYGLRNPWRISFDGQTGDLWIGDVGQRTIEEIDVIYASGSNAGVNLGWPLVEGTLPFDASGPPANGSIEPIYEYTHDDGCSVTGGVVYRGSAIPELNGIYLFGDYCAAELWGLASSESQGVLGRFSLGVGVGSGLVSFGEDGDGEVYVLSIDGTVFRLEAA